jgi:transcription initiation factor TFIIH subunit 3
LAISPANQVTVIASHIDRAAWLYPTPSSPDSGQIGQANGDNESHVNGPKVDKDNQGKYRPFWEVEQQLKHNLQALVESTTSSSLETTDSSTQIAGALTSALTYINKATIMSSPSGDSSDPSFQLPGQTQADGTTTTTDISIVSRVLIISVSGDLSSQYIAVMNSIFAAQRRHIPIDVLKLAGDVGFLQQACDATGGVYLELGRESMKGAGLLQYLMMAYLPDVTARRALVSPGSHEVDFRAACFCHRKVVDLGFVCSVCLSSEFCLLYQSGRRRY